MVAGRIADLIGRDPVQPRLRRIDEAGRSEP